MTGLLRGAGVFVGAMLLQWWWATHWPLWGASPQFLLSFTVVVASRGGLVQAMSAGFFWGLFLDVLSPHLFGANALLLTVCAYLAGSARRQVDLKGLGPQSMMVLATTWAYDIALGLLGLVFLKGFLWVGWAPFFLGALMNVGAAAVLALLWPSERWER